MTPFGLLAFLTWNNDWNHYHFNAETLNRALEQIKDLGPSILRIDLLWDEIEPSDGSFEFSRHEDLIRRINVMGIEVLGVLQYNRAKPGEDRATVWNKPPESIDAFARYVHATVSHFKKWIHHWEIWNEPNLKIYWDAPKDGLAVYSRLLKASYSAAKKADPSCFVLNGGLTQPIRNDLDHLYRNGSGNFMDAVNIHTFFNPEHPGALEQFKELLRDVEKCMSANGDPERKIWITEMGCPGVPAGVKSSDWFAGKPSNEERQAEWLETIYSAIREFPRVEKLFWAFYRDTKGEFNDGTDYLGLVRNDLTPKPAYFRFRDLARQARGNRSPAEA